MLRFHLNSLKTDLPVLLPCRARAAGEPTDLRFSHWLTSLSPQVLLVLTLFACLSPLVVWAQSGFTTTDAFAALWRWLPFIVGSGFVMNLLISFFTMAIGEAFVGIHPAFPQLPVAGAALHRHAYLPF